LNVASSAGYGIHPSVLESIIVQNSMCLPVWHSPPSWLRSISALALPIAGPYAANTVVTPSELHSSTQSREESGWTVGSSRLPGTSVYIHELVVGEHDLPPTSPGPASLTTPVSSRAAAEGAEDDGEEGAFLAADHPLMLMAEEERMLHLQAQVMTEVRNVVGHAIHPEEPLMSAGLDSRGGMELRRTLAEALGMQLPVTLLYDYQSINAIVEYINSAVLASVAGGAAAGGATGDEDESDDEDGYGRNRRQGGGGAVSHDYGAMAGTQPKVSKLFKTLRPPPKDCPLFLAAPGVANAQSAYFSFSMFLQWSTQPIYVLDKDNDLDLRALALQNASDIVAVQPEGPYLVGGHSYGGAVAVEIGMVLESWGKEVGLVLVSAETNNAEQF